MFIDKASLVHAVIFTVFVKERRQQYASINANRKFVSAWRLAAYHP